jgi:putative ABC transport system permease protein
MQTFDPSHPFEFAYFEDSLAQLYDKDKQFITLTGLFSGMCIFITCIGLFGLTAFDTQQRSKEVGIRKVLGASAKQIVLLFTKRQWLSLLTAALIASVCSYAVMEKWLSSFAYRTDINVWVFIFATLLVGGIAFLTIALQSSKTAQRNPVDSLRCD